MLEPAGLNVRLQLLPATGQPVRVDLTDPATGYTRVYARLFGEQPAEIGGVSKDDEPRVPVKADIYPVDGDARLSLEIEEPDARPERIKPQVFELETLLKLHKPAVVHDLDQAVSLK